jgi:pimeloyl-ACP methyl ester carboxylesterase
MKRLNQSVLIDGLRIACGAHGTGEPIILIHGTPSHSFIWRNVWPLLVEAGFRVHLFDLLGFGASERPRDPAVDTSVAAQDKIVTNLMDYWGLDSAHIVAHDIGGAIGLRFAIFHPEMTKSLTVINTVSYDSWPSITWQRIISTGLDSLMRSTDEEHRSRFTKQLEMVVYDKSIMSGELLDEYLSAISGPIGQSSFFQHQVRHYDSCYTEEITDKLNELGKLPVQILWGENDEWQNVSYAHQLEKDIPGASLHIIPQAGHFLMGDKPKEVSQFIEAFIREKS